MQKFNWSAAIGCLLISIAIVVAGQSIVIAINNQPVDGRVPSSFDIYNHDEATYDDFLYETQAADYLKIVPETLVTWIESGRLKGTFITVELVANDESGQTIKAGTQYIFSKAKLTELMNKLINSER